MGIVETWVYQHRAVLRQGPYISRIQKRLIVLGIDIDAVLPGFPVRRFSCRAIKKRLAGSRPITQRNIDRFGGLIDQVEILCHRCKGKAAAMQSFPEGCHSL